MSYKQHLAKTAKKMRSRNNLLMKLANSSWGQGLKCAGTAYWHF